MITPAKALELFSDNQALERFEKKIDAAITGAATSNKWPCTIAITGEFASIAAVLKERYALIGWNVQLFASQRTSEDPFLQFEKPKR